MLNNSRKQKTPKSRRTYETDTLALESLRLIAAPNPKDDMTDEELAVYCKQHRQSSELIQHLIDFVKTM